MGPGFGMYAREEGYSNNRDVGAHIIGNQFIDCVAYGSIKSAGFSFDISSNCPGAIIRDNFIQAVCYDNQGSGVMFRNKDDAETGIIKDNVVDIVCYGNNGLTGKGNDNSWAGGLGMENDNSSTHNLIESVTGSVICFENKIDVNTRGGHNCNIIVYHPDEEREPKLDDKSSGNNTVTVIDFNCSDELNEWCQQKYCSLFNDTTVTAVFTNTRNLHPSYSLSQNYPNPVNTTTSIEYTIPRRSYVSLKVFDLSGRELATLVNAKKPEGQYKVEFNRANLPSGTYFYRLHAGNFAEAKKIVLK